MRIKSVIKEILFEQKEKATKLFYNIDLFIQEFEDETEPEPEAQEKPKEEPAKEEPEAPEEETKSFGKILTEAIHKMKSSGEFVVPQQDAENIQSLEDLIDYVSDKKDKGKAIIDKLTQEIVLSLADVGTKPIEDVINEGDKILIDIDYGLKKEDSVGLKVVKNAGTNSASILMKKDGKILASPFDIVAFNHQMVYVRNSLV